MSRSYLLKVEFDKHCNVVNLRKFFTKWCGKDQIYKITNRWVTCEMGCRGGIAAEDTMIELWKQLNKKGLPTNKENIFAWSLHPDDAIMIDDEDNTPSECPECGYINRVGEDCKCGHTWGQKYA